MWSRIVPWLARSRDIVEELDFHLDALKREQLEQGATEAEAEMVARRKLGNTTAVREAIHDAGGSPALSTALRNLRFAVRTLFVRRGAYPSAIAILALGIGMSVAMFSMVDAVILRPLPFPHQESIEVIWKAEPASGSRVVELAYPELADLQQGVKEFAYVAVMPTTLYGYGKVIQSASGDRIQVESAPVSHDFFRVLGVSPILGRDFAASDEHVGSAPVVILAQSLWREQFGAERDIIGKLVTLNGRGHTVIGVMGAGVEFPRGARLWIPLGVEARLVERRQATFLQAIARVRPGASDDVVRRRVDSVFARAAADFPKTYTPSQRSVVTPIAEYWTGSARRHLWIMLGASLLLFGAATLTAGNLFLSGAIARQREVATRAALGAGPSQIASQFAAEGIVAGLTAGGAGLVLAQLALRGLVAWAPEDVPRLSDAALHSASLAFATGAATVAIAVCSTLPSWLMTRSDLEGALRSGSVRLSASRARIRTQGAFVFAHTAVTVTLLGIAGLLVASYHAMITADTGFANRDAVTLNLPLRGPGPPGAQGYDAKTRHAFYTQLLSRLREASGVRSAAAMLLRPFEGSIGWDVPYQFEFEADRTDRVELPTANFEVITPGYFQTVGTPLLAGRDFNDHDTADGERVVIIGNSLGTRIVGAGLDPLTVRLRLGTAGPWMRVVGISAPARYRSATRVDDDIFVPYLQSEVPTNYVVVRASQAPEEIAAIVRHIVSTIDVNQAIAGVATIGALVDRSAARERFNMVMLLWFAGCALILTATGTYSVIAESVAERRREIAIKMALGARKTRIVGEIVRRALIYSLAGTVVGGCAIVALGQLGSEMLYRTTPYDPVILATVLSVLFLTAVTAAWWPAWVAAGRDPQTALGRI